MSLSVEKVLKLLTCFSKYYEHLENVKAMFPEDNPLGVDAIFKISTLSNTLMMGTSSENASLVEITHIMLSGIYAIHEIIKDFKDNNLDTELIKAINRGLRQNIQMREMIALYFGAEEGQEDILPTIGFDTAGNITAVQKASSELKAAALAVIRNEDSTPGTSSTLQKDLMAKMITEGIQTLRIVDKKSYDKEKETKVKRKTDKKR